MRGRGVEIWSVSHKVFNLILYDTSYTCKSRIKIIYRQKVESKRGSLERVIYYSNLYILLPFFPLYIHPIFEFLISFTLDQVIFPSISHLLGFFHHYLSYSLQHLSASAWHLYFYSPSSHYRRIQPFSVDPTFLSFFPLTLRIFLGGLYLEKWVMMRPS